MSAMAAILGFTKNMVAGKLFRLGLCNSSRLAIDSRGPARTAIELTPRDGCMYPFGDPKEEGFHFCGGKCYPGRSYCERHLRTAYAVIGLFSLQEEGE